ncbi:MAG TPA: hypothetical protein VN915_11885 [Elusimicrobiota bacterium]|nr:hypothetical protein [Elusimicrobiota bacterium]
MNKILLALAAVLAASSARAQSEALALSARAFDASAEAAISPFILEDSFAGLPACGILDVKTIRAWSLDEAADMAAPCLKAVGARYSADMSIKGGLLSVASEGSPVKPGLILKTDLVPGSKAHRDLVASLERRRDVLLGHRVRLLTRGEAAPSSVSAVQAALRQCIMTTVVRDIQSGDDFVKIYGSCLTRNPDLKIDELRAGRGLTVDMKTEQDSKGVESLNGYVTVNAGKGPVSVMIIAYGAQTAMP